MSSRSSPTRSPDPRRAGRSAAWCALALFLCLLASCPSQAGDHVVVHPRGEDPIEVSVELATTPQARELGLMYRDQLPSRGGMLFVFPDKAPRSFWMKNTKIPLDIVFVEDDGRIARIHERTTPFSQQGLPSGAPVRFVLEVRGGFCEEHGVQEGDRIDLGTLAQTVAH